LHSDRKFASRAGKRTHFLLLATAMLGLHGCMSASTDDIGNIRASAKVLPSATNTQIQTSSTSSASSNIELQANADAALLNRNLAKTAVPADATTTAQVSNPGSVAATQQSLFSSSQTRIADASLQRTGRVVNSSQDTINAVQGSIYSGQQQTAQPVTTEAAVQSIPLPSADDASQAQELAMAGLEVPAVTTDATAQTTNQSADSSQKTSDLPKFSDAVAAVAPEEQQAKQQPKKIRTLADLFRSSATASFDDNRFGKKKLNTGSIPNMQTAGLADQALPGVTNAMMPTPQMSEDETEEDDNGPAGLMKLASLPSMARMAPNGLWTQTDQVNVSCLRPPLLQILKEVGNHYQRPVVVTSGFRDPGHNREVGGVRHSLHTLCAAADIQIQGVSKWELANYLRSIPGRGGVGTYCYTDSVHIDIGDVRDWNWRCRRRRMHTG
jgi:uncharacterized protein YcbK (DUF882 family)